MSRLDPSPAPIDEMMERASRHLADCAYSEAEREALLAQIPEDWQETQQEFGQLTAADRRARNNQIPTHCRALCRQRRQGRLIALLTGVPVERRRAARPGPRVFVGECDTVGHVAAHRRRPPFGAFLHRVVCVLHVVTLGVAARSATDIVHHRRAGASVGS